MSSFDTTEMVEIAPPPTKSVSFDMVEVIELPFALGDSPAVSTGGPPLTVAWVPLRRIRLAVSVFEQFRRRKQRRDTRRDLLISKHDRERILLQSGYTRDEIDQVILEVKRLRRLRMLSQIDHDNRKSYYDDDLDHVSIHSERTINQQNQQQQRPKLSSVYRDGYHSLSSLPTMSSSSYDETDSIITNCRHDDRDLYFDDSDARIRSGNSNITNNTNTNNKVSKNRYYHYHLTNRFDRIKMTSDSGLGMQKPKRPSSPVQAHHLRKTRPRPMRSRSHDEIMIKPIRRDSPPPLQLRRQLLEYNHEQSYGRRNVFGDDVSRGRQAEEDENGKIDDGNDDDDDDDSIDILSPPFQQGKKHDEYLDDEQTDCEEEEDDSIELESDGEGDDDDDATEELTLDDDDDDDDDDSSSEHSESLNDTDDAPLSLTEMPALSDHDDLQAQSQHDDGICSVGQNEVDHGHRRDFHRVYDFGAQDDDRRRFDDATSASNTTNAVPPTRHRHQQHSGRMMEQFRKITMAIKSKQRKTTTNDHQPVIPRRKGASRGGGGSNDTMPKLHLQRFRLFKDIQRKTRGSSSNDKMVPPPPPPPLSPLPYYSYRSSSPEPIYTTVTAPTTPNHHATTTTIARRRSGGNSSNKKRVSPVQQQQQNNGNTGRLVMI